MKRKNLEKLWHFEVLIIFSINKKPAFPPALQKMILKKYVYLILKIQRYIDPDTEISAHIINSIVAGEISGIIFKIF
jgi:hypothetical protein